MTEWNHFTVKNLWSRETLWELARFIPLFHIIGVKKKQTLQNITLFLFHFD